MNGNVDKYVIYQHGYDDYWILEWIKDRGVYHKFASMQNNASARMLVRTLNEHENG